MAIAEQLVESGLAACVQISAAGHSVYRWQGAVENAREFYLNIKTTTVRAAEVVAWLTANHPYDTPEILTLSAAASEKYLQWMRASVD